ncbi:MAG: lipase maturation factor family protein [Bryobacteraceae bacterium]
MPDPKPVLLFDGRCGFCRIWIEYWQQLTGDRIEYATSQDSRERFPKISEHAFENAVQLVRPDGSVASGAEAVFETLQMQWLCRWISGFAEFFYGIIARNRPFFYQATRFTFGTRIEPTRFAATQWLFIRALALIYFFAFWPLTKQIEGLIGSQGILPLIEFFSSVTKQSDGAIRYLAVPSIFWLSAADGTMTGMAWFGVILSGLLFITGYVRGRFERVLLAMLFVLYLSFSAAGQDFLSFQWDSLLLEAGFLAIFIGRNRVVPWLFRWLLFRLYFLSGAVKLLSGDPTWRTLTALDFHFHTQPLPNAVAWYAEKLPVSVARASTWTALAIELAAPFLIFFPRRIRMVGAAVIAGLQILIFATGNYAFFNLLTLALCIFLFDDRLLRRWVPVRVLDAYAAKPEPKAAAKNRVPAWAPAVLAVVIVGLGLAHLWQTFTGSVPGPLRAAIRYTAPLNIVNTYGLFAVMTTVRNEIELEGSDDGEHWVAYQLPYKPREVDRAPRWAAPYQPRVDWQMWFAALSNYQRNPWFVGLAIRLLQGSPQVLSLFQTNPFPVHPPKFIRATVATYTYTDWETRKKTGAWWKKEPAGIYLPAVGLRGTAGN